MLFQNIFHIDFPTPPFKTALTSNGLYETDMNSECGMSFSPPLNFCANAVPSSYQHSLHNLIYGMEHTIVSDYSSMKDREILFQALTKLCPSFQKRIVSRLKLLRHFIGSSDTWFVKLHTKKTEITELLQLLDKKSQPSSCRGGSHPRTKSTQYKPTLSKSKRLAIRNKKAAQQKLFEK